MTFQIDKQVQDILNSVKELGDQALFNHTAQFDQIKLTALRVDSETLKKAYDNAPADFIDALILAKNNIETFHRLQLTQRDISWETAEKIIRLKTVPLDRVGIYAPGGRAAYPSSVLMNAIPAMVAGVKEIALFTPPSTSPEENPVYMAAWLLGVTEVYSIGGAQAIAAAAFGTETIKKVDLISGPGNAYVTEAKRQVFGQVAIDMLAGPTELTVIADQTANPRYIAVDLLAQAEHDPQARLTLINLGTDLTAIKNEIETFLNEYSRSVANISMENLTSISAKTLQEAADIANEIAPEHLSLQTASNPELLKRITKAGSIFVGESATEALGDYAAGSNHVLPTNGTSRFSSCLNVNTFLRRYQTIEYKNTCNQDNQASQVIAHYEGLYFHKRSLEVRNDRPNACK